MSMYGQKLFDICTPPINAITSSSLFRPGFFLICWYSCWVSWHCQWVKLNESGGSRKNNDFTFWFGLLFYYRWKNGPANQESVALGPLQIGCLRAGFANDRYSSRILSPKKKKKVTMETYDVSEVPADMVRVFSPTMVPYSSGQSGLSPMTVPEMSTGMFTVPW